MPFAIGVYLSISAWVLPVFSPCYVEMQLGFWRCEALEFGKGCSDSEGERDWKVGGDQSGRVRGWL